MTSPRWNEADQEMFHWLLPLFLSGAAALPAEKKSPLPRANNHEAANRERGDAPTNRPRRCVAATCARWLEAEIASRERDQTLRVDPALEQAALRHGLALLRRRAHGTLAHIQADLFAEGLADAQVTPYAAIGAPLDGLADALLEFAAARVLRRGYTHMGIAVIDQGLRSAVVAFFVRRLIELSPLPRVPLRPNHAVQGLVIRGDEIEAYVEHPGGWVEALPVRRTRKRFTFTVPTAKPGHHRVEILVATERGPEVAALWGFEIPSMGSEAKGIALKGPRDGPSKITREPGRDIHTTSDLFRAIEGLRRQGDLAPLARDAALDKAAASFAGAVCAARIAAHVLPGQGGPVDRAQKAGYSRPVTENVAIAGSLDAAHRNLVQSPSHLRNLIDPAASYVGIGVARDNTITPSVVCVVEIFGL
ncbi:MAG: hypothetical protein IPK13_20045 [Deltaproteobacteria bacterium]|nr:hypothetical protein [Deltaproteobacteria bacterium]